MGISANVSGSWTGDGELFAKVGSSWVPADSAYVNVNGIWNQFYSLASSAIVSGGTTSVFDGYQYHYFYSSDTLSVSGGSKNIEYMIVAGGGGGGRGARSSAGGGGGAGGLILGDAVITEGTYSIVVGAAGSGTASVRTNGSVGSNSSFISLTAFGGGGGCGNINPTDGGSGGGAKVGSSYQAQGVSGQGNAGGRGLFAGGEDNCGAGGGYSSVGQNGIANTWSSGGAGLVYYDLIEYSIGGRGASSVLSQSGNPGQQNTGQGGDGGPRTINGLSGGSGVVIIRYPNEGLQLSAPDAISDLSLSSNLSELLISLNWTAPSNGGSLIRGFVIEYSSDLSSWTEIDSNVTSTEYQIDLSINTNLINGYFRVYAVNNVGAGSPSNNVFFQLPTPSAPTNLNATQNLYSIDLSWDLPPEGATDYQLQVSTDNSIWSTINDSVSNIRSYSYSGYASGGVLTYFRVAAINPAGIGVYSASISAKTVDIKASGGSISYSNGYVFHTFTSSGSFTPNSSLYCSAIVVSGGYDGESSSLSPAYGGAGGAGGNVSQGNKTINSAVSISIGAKNGGTTSISGWLSSSGSGVPGGARQYTPSSLGNGGQNGVTFLNGLIYGSSGGGGAWYDGTYLGVYNFSFAGEGAGPGGEGYRLSEGRSATRNGAGGGGGTVNTHTNTGPGVPYNPNTNPGGSGLPGIVVIAYSAY